MPQEFEYRSNPALKFIREDYQGNKFANGRYYNDLPRRQPDFKDALSWKLAGNPQKIEKRNDTYQVPRIANNSFMDATEDGILWLGHASFFMRLNGTNILTDPCLRDLPFIPRQVEIPCAIEEITKLDFILLSHGHRDHFDVPSLKKLVQQNPDVRFICPLGIGDLIKKYLGEWVFQEAAWYQESTICETVKITCLPAIHWNRRGITDFNEEMWASFMLETDTHKIYFGGDSAFGTHYADIQKYAGAPDISILGTGAYSPKIIMQSSHTSPEEAVQAAKDLGTKQFFVPMHYGTYDLSDEPIGEPIRLLSKMAADNSIGTQLKTPAVGEWWAL